MKSCWLIEIFNITKKKCIIKIPHEIKKKKKPVIVGIP